MCNLHINIRFRTWFLQLTKNWKWDNGHSEYWVKRYNEGDTKGVPLVEVIKFF